MIKDSLELAEDYDITLNGRPATPYEYGDKIIVMEDAWHEDYEDLDSLDKLETNISFEQLVVAPEVFQDVLKTKQGKFKTR